MTNGMVYYKDQFTHKKSSHHQLSESMQAPVQGSRWVSVEMRDGEGGIGLRRAARTLLLRTCVTRLRVVPKPELSPLLCHSADDPANWSV